MSSGLPMRWTVLASAMTLSVFGACGEREIDASGGMGTSTGSTDDVDLPAVSTALVVILNPVANSGHGTGVPGSVGSVRADVEVEVVPGGQGITDAFGLAVVGVQPGPSEVALLGSGENPVSLALDVVATGDVYDVAIAFDDTTGTYFDDTPIRYPVGEGSGSVVIDPGTPISQIEDALREDGRVVVLRPGHYDGDLEIRGRDILLFGEGFAENAVTIGGSIDARGASIRIRGITVEGDVIASGNDFGMSFTVVRGDASLMGNGGAFLRNVFCGRTTVPSSNATLLDNEGLPPLDVRSEQSCDDDDDDDATDD